MRNKNGGLRQIPVTALFSRKPRAFHPGHAVAPVLQLPASALYPIAPRSLKTTLSKIYLLCGRRQPADSMSTLSSDICLAQAALIM